VAIAPHQITAVQRFAAHSVAGAHSVLRLRRARSQGPQRTPAAAGGAARLLISDLLEKRRTLYSLTRDAMQECQWLKPVLVAQVEFTEWTPDGHLRQFELCRAAGR